MKKIIFILLVIISFSSCRKLVQEEFEDFDNYITVNSISAAGDSVKVFVSLTDEYNDQELPDVDNAIIEIINQNNDLLQLGNQEGGQYVFYYEVQENDSFNIVVNVPEYGQVSSSCHVPFHTEILEAEASENAWIDTDGEMCPNIKFKILNDRSRDMFYQVSVRIYTKDFYGNDGFEYDYEQNLDFFDNKNTNSDYLEQSINFSRYSWSSSTTDYAYQIVLKSLDKNLYYYFKSLDKYYQIGHPDFSTYQIVPTNFYSNILNGYGIFGAYSYSISDTIKS